MLYPERTASFSIEYDGHVYSDNHKTKVDNIYVIHSFDETYEARAESISTILADNETKAMYEELRSQFNADIELISSTLSNNAGIKTTDLLDIVRGDFGVSANADWVDIISQLAKPKKENRELGVQFAKLKYTQIFNQYTQTAFSDESFAEKVDMYIQKYAALVRDSSILNSVFDDYNAVEFGKNIARFRVFEAGHGIRLKTGTIIDSLEDWDVAIQHETERIYSDEELKGISKELSKILKKNNAMQELERIIKDNQWLIVYLKDICNLKKQMWLSYLFANNIYSRNFQLLVIYR